MKKETNNIHILKTAIDRKLTENIANLIDGSGSINRQRVTASRLKVLAL